MHPASSVKVPPGPEHSPPKGGRIPPPGLSRGQHYVYPGEGWSPHASVNPQQEPGGLTALEEPLGMLEIIRLESASFTIVPPRPSPLDLSMGRQFMTPGKSQLMLLSSPPGLALLSPGKEPPSPPSWPLGQQLVSPREVNSCR